MSNGLDYRHGVRATLERNYKQKRDSFIARALTYDLPDNGDANDYRCLHTALHYEALRCGLFHHLPPAEQNAIRFYWNRKKGVHYKAHLSNFYAYITGDKK